MLESSATVEQLVIPEVETIGPSDEIRAARRRMETSTRRSLIVVEGDRPIGIIEWRQIMRESDVPATDLVSDHMKTQFPILTRGMDLSEARTHLADIDVDRIPVVDAEGRLIGEVQRTSISHFQENVDLDDDVSFQDTVAPDPNVRPSDPDMLLEERHSTRDLAVQEGMDVVGSAGSKLGEVDSVVIDATSGLTEVIVKHGLFGRKHKRLPTDVVDHIEGDRVVLAIDQMEFKSLADIEDME